MRAFFTALGIGCVIGASLVLAPLRMAIEGFCACADACQDDLLRWWIVWQVRRHPCLCIRGFLRDGKWEEHKGPHWHTGPDGVQGWVMRMAPPSFSKRGWLYFDWPAGLNMRLLADGTSPYTVKVRCG